MCYSARREQPEIKESQFDTIDLTSKTNLQGTQSRIGRGCAGQIKPERQAMRFVTALQRAGYKTSRPGFVSVLVGIKQHVVVDCLRQHVLSAKTKEIVPRKTGIKKNQINSEKLLRMAVWTTGKNVGATSSPHRCDTRLAVC